MMPNLHIAIVTRPCKNRTVITLILHDKRYEQLTIIILLLLKIIFVYFNVLSRIQTKKQKSIVDN